MAFVALEPVARPTQEPVPFSEVSKNLYFSVSLVQFFKGELRDPGVGLVLGRELRHLRLANSAILPDTTCKVVPSTHVDQNLVLSS